MSLKDAALLGTRIVVGGYLAAHGAQKLFGAFNGPGLDAAGAGFGSMGLTPGREMATFAGATELGGGVLTVAGIADPIGPLTLAGTMAVATAVHGPAGPFAQEGGYELTITNGAALLTLAAAGPGKYRLSPSVSKPIATIVALGTVALSGYSIWKLRTHRNAQPTVEDLVADIEAEEIEELIEEIEEIDAALATPVAGD